MFSVVLETTLVRDWYDAMRVLGSKMAGAVKAACEGGAEEARTNHRYKDKSGALTKSISGRLLSSDMVKAEGEIVASAPHASFVEEPTRAHEIRPKLGRAFVGPARPGQGRSRGAGKIALRWQDAGGGVHFAGVVHHPGTKGYGFMGQAYQKAERVLELQIELGMPDVQAVLDR